MGDQAFFPQLRKLMPRLSFRPLTTLIKWSSFSLTPFFDSFFFPDTHILSAYFLINLMFAGTRRVCTPYLRVPDSGVRTLRVYPFLVLVCQGELLFDKHCLWEKGWIWISR